MNKKMLVLIAIGIPLFFCSCYKINTYLYEGTKNIDEGSILPKEELNLPANFTIQKIKNALLEYLNYRLYLYPAKIMNGTSDKVFDKFINKSVDIEIRLYKPSEKVPYSVYALTSMGKWMVLFQSKDGFIYCDGQVSEGEIYWPENGNYEVIEKYSTVIPKPLKPNYGTSERKDKMIAAFESAIRYKCEEDFYKGADRLYTEWENVDVYIADFYEFENGTHAWLCRQDGSITNYPAIFEEKNNEFKVQSIKGYTIEGGYTLKSIDEVNEFGIFQFERDISDAVRHFKCNVK